MTHRLGSNVAALLFLVGKLLLFGVNHSFFRNYLTPSSPRRLCLLYIVLCSCVSLFFGARLRSVALQNRYFSVLNVKNVRYLFKISRTN